MREKKSRAAAVLPQFLRSSTFCHGKYQGYNTLLGEVTPQKEIPPPLLLPNNITDLLTN